MAFRPLYTPILFSVALSRLMSTYDIPRSPGRKYVCFPSAKMQGAQAETGECLLVWQFGLGTWFGHVKWSF